MSKFIFDPNVKIVKSPCQEEKPCQSEPPIRVACPDNVLAIPADENFLANVDEEIFYVDASIEIKAKPSADDDDIDRENGEEAPIVVDESSPNCSEQIVPIPLKCQISLPIEDTESLYFYEVFMRSQPTSDVDDKRSHRTLLVPKYDEIDETGSACILVEKIDDGNVMIYMTVQMLLDNDENITLETLSVVNLNLQLLHEKTIQRSCVNGRFTVVINENANVVIVF